MRDMSKIKKTIEDFKKQAKAKNITRWVIHYCSMCNYPCGFLIGSKQKNIQYDNGCSCSMNPPNLREWQDLADHYNMQTNKKVIKGMNEFWGFKLNKTQS